MGGANNAVGMIQAYMLQGTAAANVSNVQATRNTSQTASSSFDNILNKVSDTLIQTKAQDTLKDANQQMTTARSRDAVTAARTTDNGSQNIKNVSADGSDTAAAQDITAQQTAVEETGAIQETGATGAVLEEAISEAGEEIISQIAENFDLSEEDIVNAMQVLGLMAADLLNPASLTQLITEATGQEEAELITDSDIYTSLQDLMEGAESMKMGLMNEFNLSEEQLQEALDEFKGNFKNNLDQAAAVAESEEVIEEEPVVIPDREVKTDSKAPVSEAFTDKKPVEEKPVEVAVSSSKEGENKGGLHSGTESQNLFNQVVNNIADAAEVAEASQAGYTDRAQMEDIIRQITDKITISAKAEETSMELSLHPASLGNVNILLTSGKDGIVAKFTAQNQIVKEAVESQMLQLQQKFDEQGIKVTSIEVTIASHGFEQNLDQQGNKNSEQAHEQRKAKGLRRINLTEVVDETPEPMNEAEKIAVQMMEANGNSVDFSA